MPQGITIIYDVDLKYTLCLSLYEYVLFSTQKYTTASDVFDFMLMLGAFILSSLCVVPASVRKHIKSANLNAFYTNFFWADKKAISSY